MEPDTPLGSTSGNGGGDIPRQPLTTPHLEVYWLARETLVKGEKVATHEDPVVDPQCNGGGETG